MAITKAIFAEKLMEEMDLTKDEAKHLVELFFGKIKDTLEQGESVKLSGFGKFELRDKAERPGRNPKTGEDIPITPRRVVTLRTGNKLKSRLKNTAATLSSDT
ncbi:integration host factor (IHF), DNA-binding protein, alpha subunit [Crenothrix polyspora]|uniref:Integration host factor subunit alpha n=1 Tax=Crenothrix polyspora TaxID=360316 RepID=A0A1R4HJ49_9GAMM|nr:integration host factor subunit alpha [Crenothrix polyspora]SJM96245.1 integration host factor (IHF), DNA-binding protein, alpha subunit [Crenothrix polyspora]